MLFGKQGAERKGKPLGKRGAPVETRGSQEADRAWWRAQSSKLLWDLLSVPGGFDSHTPPPAHLLVGELVKGLAPWMKANR